jgi:hypothetical protein
MNSTVIANGQPMEAERSGPIGESVGGFGDNA